MNLIDVDECNKFEKLNSQKKCEVCIINKQHRTFNRNSIKTNSFRRIIRKNQRFHMNFAEKDRIVRTFKKKRYVIIIVNNYIDYI